ncbi:unnamed protein product, partial [Iphiclides podalirius]
MKTLTCDNGAVSSERKSFTSSGEGGVCAEQDIDSAAQRSGFSEGCGAGRMPTPRPTSRDPINTRGAV